MTAEAVISHFTDMIKILQKIKPFDETPEEKLQNLITILETYIHDLGLPEWVKIRDLY